MQIRFPKALQHSHAAYALLAFWAVAFVLATPLTAGNRLALREKTACHLRQHGLAPNLTSKSPGHKYLARWSVRAIAALPLSFESGHGRLDGAASFIARGAGYALALTPKGAALFLNHPAAEETCTDRSRKQARKISPAPACWTRSELQMDLLGQNPRADIHGEHELQGRSNYFIGKQDSGWETDIPTFQRVRYHHVYDGIDLVFHGRQGRLEYDFVVNPGGQPDHIAFGLRGARGIEITRAGNLMAQVDGGSVTFCKPHAYQDFGGVEHEVTASFRLEGAGRIAFRLGPYDQSQTLVIDPVLSYSTYLGGSGTDQARAIAVDASGDVFVTGSTVSTDFPTTTGALSTSLAGGADIFVAKLDPTGSKLLYVTYLGGTGTDESSHIAVDASGDPYVTGLTNSSDFPTSTGAFQTSLKGANNAFVTKLSPDGSSLVYSTYLGGSATDYANSLAVDSSGDVYLTGVTFSADFPTTSGAFQTTYKGSGDAFVTELNSTGTALVYSTYLGGSSDDEGVAIAIDSSGAAYVAGVTSSTDFPTVSPLQKTLAGGKDAFVTKLAPGGASLVYSTFLGGSGDDQAADLAVDSSGDAFIVGQTNSSDFPTANAYQTVLGGGSDAFVVEINPAGTALIYSTYLGGTGDESPQALALDSAGDAYVTGETTSNDFPTANAIQSVLLGGADAFISELDPAGSSLIFSTYLGGSATDEATGIAIDSSGNIYVAGFTSSSDFPTLAGAYQPSSAGGTDAFVVQISPTAAAAVSLNKTSLTFGDQSLTTTSSPQIVLLRNMGSAALAISNIAVTGDFAQTNTCFSSVPAASTCEISVTFSPTARGSATGTVTLTDNAAGSPQTIQLSGNGIVTGVNLSAQSLTFSDQNIGTTSPPQTVMLTNTGQDPLTINGILVTGDFSQSNNCGSSVAASATCTITVTFTPTQALLRSGTLDIADNAPGSPQSVQLSGTGDGPGVMLSPSSLTFSEQPVGTTSGAQTFTLTNSGNASLAIASITISGAFTQTNNCAATLDAGSSCAFNVAFKPTLSGANYGAVTISDNAPGSPQGVQLTGNAISGKAPEVYLSSSTVTFDLQPVTTPSSVQVLTLTNTGNDSLSVTSIAATGVFSETNTCGSSVAAGAKCTISVVFTPTAAGPASGQLTITDNASDSPQSAMLAGGGDDFAFSASSSSPSSTNKTINAGQTATYTLNVNPIYGFNQKIALTCSGAPQAASCSVQPATVTLDGKTAASSTVTVTTLARSMLAPLSRSPRGAPTFLPGGASLTWLILFLTLGLALAAAGARRFRAWRVWLVLGLLLPLLLWSSCNVGAKIIGTPPGNYTLTITGTTAVNGATLTHTGNLGLTVN